MRDLELGMAFGLGKLLSADDRFGGTLGESVGSHRTWLCFSRGFG